jgi:hypothetical protein
VWKTDDWVDYEEAEVEVFPHYTFSYPRDWTFTGHSVFNDGRGNKVAELMPGVVRLSAGQRCFGLSGRISDGPFRFGNVRGRVVVFTTQFDDSDETYRVHEYCVQKGDYAFVIRFYELAHRSSSAATFRSVVRSIKLAQ